MKKYIKYLPPVIAFVGGMAISIILYNFEKKEEEQERKEYLEQHILERRFAIENEMKSNLNILKLFQHDWDVPYHEFEDLTKPILKSHESVSSLFWVKKVAYEKEFSEKEKIIENGIEDFNISELNASGEIIIANKRDFYFPIFYKEPNINNELVKGFDLGSIKRVKHEFEDAQVTGELRITECLDLFNDSNKQDFFAILPIFSSNLSNDNSEMHDSLKGFIVAAFDISRIIENTISNFKEENIGLIISDETDLSEISEIFSSSLKPDKDNTTVKNLQEEIKSFSYNIKISNRVWKLEFYTLESLFKDNHASFMLKMAVLITIIITLYLGISAVRSDKVKKLSKNLLKEVEAKNKIEKVLRESEKKFRLLYENAPLSYQSLNINGCFIDVNKTWLNTLGFSREEVIGRHFSEFMTPKSAALVKSRFEYFKQAGELHDIQFEMVRKDKTKLYVSFEGKVGYDELGCFKQTHCIFQDITESRKAELALKASEEKYREFVEGTDDLITQVDGEGKFLFVNHTAEQVFGLKPEECIGKNAFDFIHPDDIEMTIREFEIWTKNKVAKATFENRSINKDGISYNLLWTISLHYNEIGNVKEINSIATNITERKKAEKEIVKLHKAVEQSANSILITDPEGNIEYVNKKFTQLTGYKLEEAVGKNPRILKSGKHSKEFYKELWSTISKGKEWNGETQNRKKNGEMYWEKSTITPVMDENNKITNYIAIKEDITKQKKLEKELHTTQMHYTDFINTSGEAVSYWKAPEGLKSNLSDEKQIEMIRKSVCIDGNRAYWKMMGLNQKADLIGKVYEDLLTVDEDVNILRNFISNNYQLHNYENQIMIGGKKIYSLVNWHGSVEDGYLKFIWSKSQDITKQKNAEILIRESEEKYRATFITSPDAININTMDGVYVDINEGFTKITGYTREDIIGESSLEKNIWTKPEDRKILILELKNKGECNNLESVFRCKNGETVIGLMSAKIIHLDEVAHILTITRDITKQKEREKLILKTILDTEERERKRFAEDLHDELGPFLSGIKLYIKELGYQDVSYEQRLSIIEYLNEFINSAVEKTRSISNQLMPNVLTDYGLVKALNSFCTKISHTKEINIGFKSNITKNIDNSTIEVILYRIAIELINNTIKHAEANLIDISLNQFNDIIQLTYIDNGKGFDIEKELEKEKGFGLRNMINRLHSIKGNYKFLKKAKGFQLNIIIDLSLT